MATAIGVNGANVYTATGMGDVRVALYTSLVRGANDVSEFVRATCPSQRNDLWLIAFQGRDVRGGKGERTAALNLLALLCEREPERARAALKLLPTYGCWRDLLVLAAEHESLRSHALDVIREQYWADWTAFKAQRPISLLAKWLPREQSAMHKLVAPICKALYGAANRSQFIIYRRQVGAMSAHLKVVERNMCGGTWDLINPGAVPGRCMNLNRRAFLNVDKRGKERRADESRRQCAANFKEHLAAVLAGKATMNGGDTVYPHTICRQMLAHGDAEGVLVAQWQAIREKIGVTGRIVPMCDFSGSMSGIPMDVSLALGTLLSEVNHPTFRNMLMTFDSTPKWITFREDMTLLEKFRYAKEHGQGLSTNFEAALQLVLDRMREGSMPAGEQPQDLVVFTDMGFDDAARSGPQWNTVVEVMRARFEAAGYTMPRLVIWNLRSDFKEYHARAQEVGVVMLSGWSPSAMKVITDGIAVATPYQAMRAILDDARYDAVRGMLAATAT